MIDPRPKLISHITAIQVLLKHDVTDGIIRHKLKEMLEEKEAQIKEFETTYRDAPLARLEIIYPDKPECRCEVRLTKAFETELNVLAKSGTRWIKRKITGELP